MEGQISINVFSCVGPPFHCELVIMGKNLLKNPSGEGKSSFFFFILKICLHPFNWNKVGDKQTASTFSYCLGVG